MEEINLSNSQISIVDKEDFDFLNQWNWSFDGNYATRSQHIRISKNKYRSKKIYMHRLIMGNEDELVIDHINKNKIDNRKSNLRFSTVSSNIRNGSLRKSNKSGVQGVYWCKFSKKWVSQIMVKRKHIHLGKFSNKQEAISARKVAEEKYFKV